MGDLKWLRMNGLEAAILKLAAEGTLVMGICGGYQMLGQELSDPHGVEAGGQMRGMGLLPVRTIFTVDKTMTRVKGRTDLLTDAWRELSHTDFEGYEIHMGHTEYAGNAVKFSRLRQENGEMAGSSADGCQYENVVGTYVHGIFDHSDMQAAILGLLCRRKGLPADAVGWIDEKAYKEQQYDRLAAGLRESLDMAAVYQILDAGL